MSTLFISDLHLSAERPDIISLFVKFMKNSGSEADALYILGDLFEVWIGDDYIEPGLEPAIEAISKFSKSGKPVFVMHGNRDFLMREGFVKLTGCKLLDDPCTITLNGEKTLVSHGDALCIDDLEYMEFRKMVRDPAWQNTFLEKSLEERIAFARQARSESKSKIQQKPMDIMDVNQDAVEELMKKHDVKLLIHGHTHRPNTHHFTANGRAKTRIVLGDWYEKGSVLICDNSGCNLKTISL